MLHFFLAVALTADADLPHLDDVVRSLELGRKREIAYCDKWYRSGRVRLSRAKGDPQTAAEIRKIMDDLQKRRRELETAGLGKCTLPVFDADILTPGTIGSFDTNFVVVEVPDQSTMVLRNADAPGASPMRVTGRELKAAVKPGTTIGLPGAFRVVKNDESGLHVEWFDIEKYEDAVLRIDAANADLKLAKQLLDKNRTAAETRLREIVQKYPDTDAAKEAKELLK